MSGATKSGALTATSSWQRRWTPGLAGVGIVLLAVTACGSSGSSSTPTATPAAASTPKPSSSANAFPGIVGTAAAVSGSSMEVQNPTSGQVTVTFTASTPITDTVTATAKDVTVGSCVTVVGKPSTTTGSAAAKSVTATTVTISAPVKGECTGAGGFAGGGFGGGGFGGGNGATPRPSFSARPRPTGSRGAFADGFGGADGKVLSVSATGFVVQARTRTPGSTTATTTSVTVITNSASKYSKTITATAAALKVGLCITAVGTANSIGAIAAKSIRITQPGPSGCVTTFGRGGFGRPTANA